MLEIIGTVQRSFASGHFAILSLADRGGQEEVLQLENDLVCGCLAVKQFNQPMFDRMIGSRVIDLFGMLMLGADLGENRAGWCAENTFQIAQEERGVKVLPNGFGGFAAEIFQIQPAFHHVVKGFVIPAPAVNLVKFLGGIYLFIQQGGG